MTPDPKPQPQTIPSPSPEYDNVYQSERVCKYDATPLRRQLGNQFDFCVKCATYYDATTGAEAGRF